MSENGEMVLPTISDTIALKKGAARRKSIMLIESFPVYKKKQSLPSTTPEPESIPLFNERLLGEGTPSDSKLTDQEQLLNSIRRFDQYLMRRQNTLETTTANIFEASTKNCRSTISHCGTNGVLYDYLNSTKHGQGIRIVRDSMQKAPESIELCRLSASVILHTLICLEKVRILEESCSKLIGCDDKQNRKPGQGGDDGTQDARIRRLTMLSSRHKSSSLSQEYKTRSVTRLSALQTESSATSCTGEKRSNRSFWLPTLPAASDVARVKGNETALGWTAEIIKMNLLKVCLVALNNSTGEQFAQALLISVLRKFLKLCPEASIPLLMNHPLTFQRSSWHAPLSFCCGLAIVLRSMQIHENSFDMQAEGAALILELSSTGQHDVSAKICQLEWRIQCYSRQSCSSSMRKCRGSAFNIMIRIMRRWKQITDNGVQAPHRYLSTLEQQKCLLAHKKVTQALAKLVTDNLLELHPKDLAFIKRMTWLHNLNLGP